MRVTQNYSVNSLLHEINRSKEKIVKLQKDLSSGKQINNISDDPVNIEKLMKYKNLLKLNLNYQKKIENTLDFMSFTSESLNDAVNLMSQAKEISIRGSQNLGINEWEALASQIDNVISEMADVANSRFNDRYIFGGSYSNGQPVFLNEELTDVSFNENSINAEARIEYGENKIENYNISGSSAFLEQVDIFQSLIDLRDAFNNQDSTAIQGIIKNLDKGISQIVEQNANIGAKINKFELYHQQYQTQELKLQEYISNIEDTDIAEAIMNLQKEENGLSASLEVLSRSLNISLMDYIG